MTGWPASSQRAVSLKRGEPMTPLVSVERTNGGRPGSPSARAWAASERSDGGMARDDAIILEADGPGVIFAMDAQRPERVATACVARGPAIDVPGLRFGTEHNGR